MELSYRKAVKDDANLLIDIYNSSFYDDYVRYGECPAYGKTKEGMEFYTEKCGFSVANKVMDGNVEVVNFYRNR
ncbi:hypothetical protein [Ruminococcus sp. 5_1_39BFAA]|uniref:hypothetical protein n=1 Tax=Ruminococcus sp. 5_1_39BFAA TaxID=457412 RepID=UPI0035613DD1